MSDLLFAECGFPKFWPLIPHTGNIRVGIDYRPLGVLGYGDTLNHVIAPGPHTVRVSEHLVRATPGSECRAGLSRDFTMRHGTSMGPTPVAAVSAFIALGLWVTIE
jgi:hypothetical protein